MNIQVALTVPRAPVDLLDGLRRTIPAMSSAAAASDLHQAFPVAALALLARTGLLSAFAPAASGGVAWTDPSQEAMAMFEALRLVGRADLSLGRVFEGHVNALKLFQWYATARQLADLATDLAQDRVFGVWATEPAPGVGIEPGRDGPVLTGAKSFATGASHIDYAVITARVDHGPQLVVVPADQPARTDASAWTMRGMRGTVSGSYDLTGLPAEGRVLLGEPGDYLREPRFTAGAWRFTAVQLGGIERIVALLRDAMSPEARAEPLLRGPFADAVVASRTAYLWVREAADRAFAEVEDAVPFALMTRGVVERAGLDVMEIAARVIGTRSFVTGSALDKATRDLGVYLRQASPLTVKDRAAKDWLERDRFDCEDRLW